ncbi:hypothetical protein B5S28_g3454 [[Candida] boidinii]|nr:hypothetical protein B5S28_g3454 [[Candida] boidinii]OWB63356.1 hypothetical protein B5S29_g4331 [[Candida] boidinii]OWB74644.1 hypothetical protein B5S31_g4456 [[Candida] boidinii]OWB78692.1 hypothetical protein B5S32_g2892 [[Candida] boidinii]
MSEASIKRTAIKEIKEILPLDDDTLGQMIDYAINNLATREDVTQHFINLLGESPASLNFITHFQQLKFGSSASSRSNNGSKSIPSSSPPPVKPTNPVASKPKSQPKVIKIVSGAGRNGASKIITKKIVKKETNVWGSGSDNKSEQPKQQPQNRLAKNSTGASTSELLDLKPSTVSKQSISKKTAKKKLDNLKDLDSALLELEINDPNSIDYDDSNKIRRVCNCMATRHPLFEMFPNCLNCGKIICAKEGLQPCSSCGKPLLNNEERLQILSILKSEKEELEGKKAVVKSNEVTGKKKKNKITISMSSTGQNNFKIQEQLFNRIEKKRELEKVKLEKEKEEKEEVDKIQKELDYYASIKGKDEELIKAQERLDKLLNFQDNGVERTKIIDQASDFELPSSGGSTNLWASPMERALQLKRQQKVLRKQELSEKQRSGRGKKVMNMAIRDGKVILQERSITADEEVGNFSDDEEIQDLQNAIKDEKKKDDDIKAKNSWNYEKDKLKWEKPVYIPNAEDDKSNNNDSENKENSPEDDEILSNVKPRIQLGTTDELEDALFQIGF